MAFYYNETDKPLHGIIRGSVGLSEKFDILVQTGFLYNHEDGKTHTLIAEVSSFDGLQKFGDKSFKINELHTIALTMHSSAWMTKKYDKEAKKYTDEEIKNIPSGAELALITYLNARFPDQAQFRGNISMDNSKHVVAYLADNSYSKIEFLYELNKWTSDPIDAKSLIEFFVKSSSGSSSGGFKKTYKSTKEVFDERFSLVKQILSIDDNASFLESSAEATVFAKQDPEVFGVAIKLLALLLK